MGCFLISVKAIQFRLGHQALIGVPPAAHFELRDLGCIFRRGGSKGGLEGR